MHREFEELSAAGKKVGEAPEEASVAAVALSEMELAASQGDAEDTSCGLEEEGQDPNETKDPVTPDSGKRKEPLPI